MEKGSLGQNLSAYYKAALAVKKSGMLKNINFSVMKTARELKKSGNLGAASLFALHAVGIPDKTALIYRDERISYRELNSRMNRLARGMQSLGIRPGDRILMMIANSSAYIETLGAVNKLGGSIVPVSTSLKSEELAYIMQNSQSRSVLFSEQYLDVVRGAVHESADIDKSKSIIVGHDPKGEYREYDDILSTYSDEEVIENLNDVENPVLMYTSGTTGRPKGAVRDLRKVNPIVFPFIIYEFGLNRNDVFFTPCPFYHAGPTAFIPLTMMVGATLIVGEKFDPHEAVRLMGQYRASMALMVPTHYQRLAALPKEEFTAYEFKDLRGIISTGSHFTPALKKKITDIFGPKIYDLYGATEVGMALLAKPEDVEKHPDSIGRPMLGNSIRLLDAQGKDVPPGEPGELYVQSAALFQGYHNNQEATDEASQTGYFTVGDIARQDPSGYYFICDRKSDMVISGGVNIYPREVEDILIRHPAINDVAIVGKKDDEWGEVLVAFVVLQEEEKVTAEEIREFTGQHLASYKKPKTVIFMEELPRNPQGKLLKKELRRRLEQGEFTTT